MHQNRGLRGACIDTFKTFAEDPAIQKYYEVIVIHYGGFFQNTTVG